MLNAIFVCETRWRQIFNVQPDTELRFSKFLVFTAIQPFHSPFHSPPSSPSPFWRTHAKLLHDSLSTVERIRPAHVWPSLAGRQADCIPRSIVSGRQQRKKYVHNSQVGQVIRWHDEVSLPLNTRPPPPSTHRLPIKPFISNEFNVFNEEFNLIMHKSTKVTLCACVCICEVLNWEPEV